EPLVGLRDQARAWEAAYFTFLLLVGLTAVGVLLGRLHGGTVTSSVARTEVTPSASEAKPITWRRRVRWILLAAIPSTWMLSVSSYFTTVIRPMPLLWVIPLALYLFSFAVVFARRSLVSRYWINRLFPFYALPVLGMVLLSGGGPFWFLALLHFGAFFLAALLCHGELAHDRPSARHLTEFYWWLALGGALGGLVSAVIGPLVFNDFIEYPIAIVGAALLRRALQPPTARRWGWPKYAVPIGLTATALVIAGLMLIPSIRAPLNGAAVTPSATALDLGRISVVFAIPATASVVFLRRPHAFGTLSAAMLVLSLFPLGSQ